MVDTGLKDAPNNASFGAMLEPHEDLRDLNEWVTVALCNAHQIRWTLQQWPADEAEISQANATKLAEMANSLRDSDRKAGKLFRRLNAELNRAAQSLGKHPAYGNAISYAGRALAAFGDIEDGQPITAERIIANWPTISSGLVPLHWYSPGGDEFRRDELWPLESELQKVLDRRAATEPPVVVDAKTSATVEALLPTGDLASMKKSANLKYWAVGLDVEKQRWILYRKVSRSKDKTRWDQQGNVDVRMGDATTLLKLLLESGGFMSRDEGIAALRPAKPGKSSRQLVRAITDGLSKAKERIKTAIADTVSKNAKDSKDVFRHVSNPIPNDGSGWRVAVDFGHAIPHPDTKKLHFVSCDDLDTDWWIDTKQKKASHAGLSTPE